MVSTLMVSHLRRESRCRHLSLQAFPPWGTLPLLKFGPNERLHFDLLECTFPLLLYGQYKVSQMSFLDSCFISFLGENSVK